MLDLICEDGVDEEDEWFYGWYVLDFAKLLVVVIYDDMDWCIAFFIFVFV